MYYYQVYDVILVKNTFLKDFLSLSDILTKAKLTECLAEKLVNHNISNSLLTHIQEEVNILLILHAVTVPHETNLVVSSPNTDALLLLVQMYPHLPVSAVFLGGEGRLKRNIGVGYIHKHFVQQHIS